MKDERLGSYSTDATCQEHQLVSLEVNNAIAALMTTATAAHCHSSLIVTPTGSANRAAQQGLLWLVYANFVKRIRRSYTGVLALRDETS